MKKIISSILAFMLIFNYTSVIAATSYTLSAIVGNSNHAPVVTLITPDTDPRLIANSTESIIKKQSYTIKYRDDEKDEVTYTITTVDGEGSVTVNNGTIIPTQYDINNEAYITFDYISPIAEIGYSTITVTISDGANVTVQILNIYIY